jgi:hypothetical protein
LHHFYILLFLTKTSVWICAEKFQGAILWQKEKAVKRKASQLKTVIRQSLFIIGGHLMFTVSIFTQLQGRH